MQAIILAGGLGLRLRPITKTIPKPMAPVAGAPYLEHQLRLLARQDIRDIVLLTGYLGEQIRDYFGESAGLGLSIRYSQEPAPMGTGGALRLAADLLDDSFLVIYGDSYLPIYYADLLDELAPRAVAGVVAVYDNRLGDTSVRNNISLGNGSRIACYDKAGTPGWTLDYVEAGVLAFKRDVLKLIPPSRPVSLEQEVFPHLIRRGELYAHITTQRFYDIGTLARLQQIEDFLRNDHYSNAVSR